MNERLCEDFVHFCLCMPFCFVDFQPYNRIEPRHEKTCLREFPTKSDSYWPAQLQKLLVS